MCRRPALAFGLTVPATDDGVQVIPDDCCWVDILMEQSFMEMRRS
jgi:hypothetical protein